MDFQQRIVQLLAKETGLPAESIAAQLAVPPDSALGDYAFPCFIAGKNPVDQARRLASTVKLPRYLSKIQAAGPYLNFFLDTASVAEELLPLIRKQKKRFGAGSSAKNLVIEYCGPNTNKPLHLGHLRNMALGNALCSLLAFQGNTVHPVNIVNDRGIHICQSMLAYQKWGNNRKPDKKGDHFVGDFYVLFANKLKEDPELKEEAQEMLFHWEDKNPEVQKLWKKMTPWVLAGFAETYKRFGIAFEKEYFESEYYEQGKEIAFAGLRRGIFEKDDQKNITARLEVYNLPNKVVLRGDGTSVYITQDLCLAQKRYDDYHFDRMVYVVASEQQLHFQQLFKIMELLERPYAKKLFHLSYGMIHLPTGRMKSREGTVIDADDLMDEIEALARKEVDARYTALPEKEKKHRAEKIALAALKFHLLKTDPLKDIVFDPEESLSFDGETGPYVQYTHARACSILGNAAKIPAKADLSLLKEPTERTLLLQLLKFSGVTAAAAAQYKLHMICRYLLDLSQAFNEYYHKHRVLSDDRKLTAARIQVVDAVRQVLQNGLGLLGITALKEM